MIQKKSFGHAIKRALQSGTFNYVGQQTNQVPPQLFRLQELPLDGQNWWDCVPITKMDFSNNSISVISEKIIIFSDLQLLRFKNNLLSSLPNCLPQFPNFKLLDVSRNKITSVPNHYSNFPALVELNLSQNSITSLPDLSAIKTLEVVFINDNKLKSLPILGQNIKKLQASSNSISQLTYQSFKRCSKLQVVNLNKNGIQKIAKGCFSHTNGLILLQLKENRLSSFDEMPQSAKLDTIALAFNRLTQFNSFQKCPNLSILILNDNKIKKIAPEIVKLQKLKTLDLSNNDLPDLPSELGFIDGLVRLQLEGNPLKSIRQNIRAGGVNTIKKYLKDRMDPSNRENIQKKLMPSNDISPHQYWTKLLQQFTTNGQLVLRGMKLQALHESTFTRDLRVINVTDNKLTQISQEIGRLQNLKNIIINSNQISKLPENLSIISSLESIQAQHNKLTDFISFSKPYFPALLHLDLSTNRLTRIPDTILKVPKLRTLLLSYNKINSIQNYLQQDCLSSLEILDVSNNILEDVSDLIFSKYSLNYLNFQNNNLSRLPTVLGFMKLMGLKVDGNPLKMIKRQIIEKGSVALLQFLRNKHQGQIPVKSKKQIQRQQPAQDLQKFYKPPEKESQSLKIRSKPLLPSQQKQKNEDKEKMIAEIEKQIRKIEIQLENGLGLNNWQKTDKRKRMQALMIQRNKLMKQ